VEGIPVSSGFLTILELQAMRADQLAGEAASDRQKGRTSIAWLNERIAQHYTTAKDTETDKRKVTILHQTPRSHSWIVLQIGLRPGSNRVLALGIIS
jgi:hypothetical protein